MNINDFISNFSNHPVLFMGTGISLRYLKNSYTWDTLLKKISFELTGNNEHYLDLKSNCCENSKYSYEEIANVLESEFNKFLQKDRNGKFKKINDIFYANMENSINLSRFKIYLSEIFKDLSFNENKQEEILALKRVRKNIGSIITTNYDELIENIFEFKPLIGNNILLSNPYGSVYKIHGCVTDPKKIIITSDDYSKFEKKYELIRAQLLSLFIHNPIIFIGYSINDENIKSILKTIFTYVEPNSDIANKIRSNFLLVEYEEYSMNNEVSEHDIVIDNIATIRINKIKTDDYMAIYNALSVLQLPVSAMDIRKVQNIVKEIYAGGNIKVSITEDLEQLDNKDKVLVIGSERTIKYEYQTTSEMMVNYFNIIDESNFQLLELINKYTIQSNQYFPIFAFSKINPRINYSDKLKRQQTNKLNEIVDPPKDGFVNDHTNVDSILKDDRIFKTNKTNAIIYAILKSQLDLDQVENYLKGFDHKYTTEYRKLLCAYDYMKYK